MPEQLDIDYDALAAFPVHPNWLIRANEIFRAQVMWSAVPGVELHISRPLTYRLLLLGTKFSSSGHSSGALRESSQPLYDTEIIPAGFLDGKQLYFFQRPMGQMFTFPPEGNHWGKTEVETNMVVSNQLPQPQSFICRGFRAEMDIRAPLEDRLAVFHRGMLKFEHGNKIIFQLPLSQIPCGSLLEHPEIKPPARVPAAGSHLGRSPVPRQLSGD